MPPLQLLLSMPDRMLPYTLSYAGIIRLLVCPSLMRACHHDLNLVSLLADFSAFSLFMLSLGYGNYWRTCKLSLDSMAELLDSP